MAVLAWGFLLCRRIIIGPDSFFKSITTILNTLFKDEQCLYYDLCSEYVIIQVQNTFVRVDDSAFLFKD